MAANKGKERFLRVAWSGEGQPIQGQIKHAYRKLAMKYHPSEPGNEEAAEKFKEVSTAYAVFRTKQKEQYDIHGEDGSVLLN